MNLAYFPFDSQMCTVEIESFGYTMADLKYSWYRWVTNTALLLVNQFLIGQHFWLALNNTALWLVNSQHDYSLIGQHSTILLSDWSTLNNNIFHWCSGDESVQMSPDVMLPQFNVLGHRQRLIGQASHFYQHRSRWRQIQIKSYLVTEVGSVLVKVVDPRGEPELR